MVLLTHIRLKDRTHIFEMQVTRFMKLIFTKDWLM